MATAGLVEQSADLNDLVDENDVKEEGDEDEEVCIRGCPTSIPKEFFMQNGLG